MDLSVIIVNWNVRELLRNCLQSLLDSKPPHLTTEIIVVDSASADGSPDMVRAEFPQVRLIASDQNLGYAKGNNTGAETALGRYLLMLNPDTVVGPTALSRLVEIMDATPLAGAIGPQLRWPDGSVQSSRRRFPTLGSLFWESTLLGQWFPNNHYVRNYHMKNQSADHLQQVDWIVGAAIMIRHETWRQVGPIDETFFMYFEETDWCHRCAEAGWEVYYDPKAVVKHFEGKSSEQVISERTIRFQRSKIRYTHKYFGAAWASLLRIFLRITFFIQWLEETLKWLVGHRRTLRRERMVAYGQVLRRL